MRSGSHARPSARSVARRLGLPGGHPKTDSGATEPGSGWWRIGTPLVVLICGGLFVVSADNSDGTDLRPGRYTDLAALVRSESDQYDVLRQRVQSLTAEVATLTSAVQDRTVNRYQRRIKVLEDPAGRIPHQGPGITVTLADAPEAVVEKSEENLNFLVVHQQDIQAVVNAMWRGGASAVTVQGQRIVSTTGIKCEGNAVTLQGVPYSQPYRISAVGDPLAMAQAIDGDSYLDLYRNQAADPSIAVGWELEVEDRVEAPAYDGLLDLSYATPLT